MRLDDDQRAALERIQERLEEYLEEEADDAAIALVEEEISIVKELLEE